MTKKLPVSGQQALAVSIMLLAWVVLWLDVALICSLLMIHILSKT
jgi:hypothetical protein